MTSRVEELQRMCDNINENGGLDSGEWHTALLAQIAQNLAVIADVMMADRKTEPSNSEKPNNCDPQTERIKTLDYCDICNHKGCDNCIANSLDDYCVPSGYEPTTQTETQSSNENSNVNLTFEKTDEPQIFICPIQEENAEYFKWLYGDEPQTEADWKDQMWTEAVEYDPQTERSSE